MQFRTNRFNPLNVLYRKQFKTNKSSYSSVPHGLIKFQNTHTLLPTLIRSN